MTTQLKLIKAKNCRWIGLQPKILRQLSQRCPFHQYVIILSPRVCYTVGQYNLLFEMAPKPAPKLTKKQLQQLKKEEQRKKEAEEKQRREEEEARLQEKLRLDEVERQRRADEERVRIVIEKEKYRPSLEARLRDEENAVTKLAEERAWARLTEEYHKSYDTARPKLSTFIKVLEEQRYEGPARALKSCEQAQTYVRHIGHEMLHRRGVRERGEERHYWESMLRIRRVEVERLEQVMIEMAKGAQEMEDKNNEINKKGEPNKKVEGAKILEYQHHMSPLAKIGMFLNSSTTKNLNKFRPIEIREFGLNTEIPSKWMNANTIVKFQWLNFNPYAPDTYEKFLIVGGTYTLEFYELLLASKKINNIVLKKHYKGAEILEKFKLPTALIKEPFNVTYQIPKYVFLHTFDQAALRFAQFDAATARWALLPADTAIEYDPVDKRATCRIFRPEPIAYVQDRTTDFPYVAWELRSVEAGKAQLDIELRRWRLQKEGQERRRLMVKFEIDAYSARLVAQQSFPELQDLTEGSWTPASLLYQLSERGIHLLPVDEDYQQARVPVKDRKAEENAIRDIAYAVEAFYIRSEINDSSEVVAKIRENLEYERVFLEDQEKDWKKIRWLADDRCEVSNRNIVERHLNLEVLLQEHNFCLPECLDRMRYEKNYLFKRNLMELLTLTRVLSFTTAVPEESHLRWVLKEKELVKA